MALLDLLDEVSKKQITKTALGDERLNGIVVGIVTENYDEKMPGRICVTIPVRDDGANELKWAKVSAPYTGKGWGEYFLPEKQDQVLVAFENGNIEKPYIVGCIPRDHDSFIKKSADAQNTYKRIVTRNGSYILFEDGNEEKKGDDDIITVATSGNRHLFQLDNKNSKMTLTDHENNCHIGMDTKDGRIEINAASKITITVGSTIKVVMDGESGRISVEADKIITKVSGNIGLEADGNVKISGSQTRLEASTALKVESDGFLKLAGSPIKMG